MYCSMLQCVAVCCSVLHCVALCTDVLVSIASDPHSSQILAFHLTLFHSLTPSAYFLQRCHLALLVLSLSLIHFSFSPPPFSPYSFSCSPSLTPVFSLWLPVSFSLSRSLLLSLSLSLSHPLPRFSFRFLSHSLSRSLSLSFFRSLSRTLALCLALSASRFLSCSLWM